MRAARLVVTVPLAASDTDLVDAIDQNLAHIAGAGRADRADNCRHLRLELNGAEWVGGAPARGVPPLSAFVALATLRLHACGLRALPAAALAAMPLLIIADFSSNLLVDVNDLAVLPPQLKTLRLSCNMIEALPQRALAHFTSLTDLDVSFNAVRELHLPHEACAQLEMLDISGNHFIRIVPLVAPQLEVLRARGCLLGHDKTERLCMELLSGLFDNARAPPLSHLDLSGNMLDTQAAGDVVAVLAARPLTARCLTKLDLSCNDIAEWDEAPGRNALVALLPRLRELDLSHNRLALDAVARTLAPPPVLLTYNNHLKGALELHGNGGNPGVPWLAKMRRGGYAVRETTDLPVLVYADWLYVGSAEAAKERSYMKRECVPPVESVVCASRVATRAYPRDLGYLVVDVQDNRYGDLRDALDEAASYIHAEHKRHGSGVLVHCHAGVSRSVTLVAAYMLKYARTPLTLSAPTEKQARAIVAETLALIHARHARAAPSAHFRATLAAWARATLLY